MQAGENLCSLKSRNNCIMRRKIFDIYKALRHFNVTANEVDEIASGFKYWLGNQVDELPSCHSVYFMGDKLYSMPYPSKKLINCFIGIEIDGVVYLDGYYSDVRKFELENKLNKYKANIAEKFSAIDQFELRLPTVNEAQILIEKTCDLKAEPTREVWIISDLEHLQRTNATVGIGKAKPHYPPEFSSIPIRLYLVTKPDDEQIFYGKVDKYGTPTKDTLSIYNQLYDRLF